MRRGKDEHSNPYIEFGRTTGCLLLCIAGVIKVRFTVCQTRMKYDYDKWFNSTYIKNYNAKVDGWLHRRFPVPRCWLCGRWLIRRTHWAERRDSIQHWKSTLTLIQTYVCLSSWSPFLKYTSYEPGVRYTQNCFWLINSLVLVEQFCQKDLSLRTINRPQSKHSLYHCRFSQHYTFVSNQFINWSEITYNVFVHSYWKLFAQSSKYGDSSGETNHSIVYRDKDVKFPAESVIEFMSFQRTTFLNPCLYRNEQRIYVGLHSFGLLFSPIYLSGINP